MKETETYLVCVEKYLFRLYQKYVVNMSGTVAVSCNSKSTDPKVSHKSSTSILVIFVKHQNNLHLH